MGWLDDLNKDLKHNREKFKESGLTDGKIKQAASVSANNKSRANGSDPNWTAATIASNKSKAKDPKWLEATTKASRRKAEDPKWLESTREGSKRRSDYGKWLKENDPEEHKRYFGTIDQHTEETKEQMSASATARWAKTMKRVMAEGVEYENHYAAAEALGIHKDTIIYRIKNKSEKWNGWYYIQ